MPMRLLEHQSPDEKAQSLLGELIPDATDTQVLAVQANSTNNRAVTNTTEAGQGCTRIQTAVFAADSAQGGATYVALLNPSDQAREVSVTFKQLGIQVRQRQGGCSRTSACAVAAPLEKRLGPQTRSPPFPLFFRHTRQVHASRATSGPSPRKA